MTRADLTHLYFLLDRSGSMQSIKTDTEGGFAAFIDEQRKGTGECRVTLAQFVMLTPYPGTIDFQAWEKSLGADATRIAGIPVTRHWLIPQANRPKVYTPHPVMSPDEIRARTQGVWDRFYSLSRIWERSKVTPTLRSRLAFILVSKLYRQMYANTGIATDSARVARSAKRARMLARIVRRLFVAAPMPDLQEPAGLAAKEPRRLSVQVIPS